MSPNRTVLLLLVLSLIPLSSCIYGPETDIKKTSDYFNRKNYQGGMIGIIPVAKAKKRNTIIEGIALMSDYTPFKFKTVFLLDANGVKVSETTTTAKGVFRFMDYIENGHYLIKTESNCWSGEISIQVDGYQLDNIMLQVKPSKARQSAG